jgi:iron complex outermembrane receptor protein
VPSILPTLGEASFRQTTPRFSLRQDLAAGTNVYFTYSEGFKSGVFDALATAPVQPEKIKAYELGIKSQPLSNVQINADIYYYDYKNLQVQTNNDLGFSVLQNAGSAKIEGAELEAAWQVARQFKLDASLSLIPVKHFVDYTNAAVFIPGPAGGAISITTDQSGSPLPKVPHTQANLRAGYEDHFSWGTFSVDGSLAYSSGYNYDQLGIIRQRSNTIINASAYWTPVASAFKFGVWVKNLTNEPTVTDYLTSGAGLSYVSGPPLSAGASVRYSF